MPRHVDNIIDTSPNPDIPIGIASGAIASEVVSRIGLRPYASAPRKRMQKSWATDLHISFQVPFVVLPDGSCNRWPWILERKHTFDAVTREQRSFLWLQNARLDTKEWHSGTARLGRNSARERGDDDRTRFSLPKRVDNSTLFFSDVFIVPMPCLRIDGLADGSEDPQR
jgi:hypothetical protein